tara:strand:+ start:281 stop:427 length:147 start_codon:yes stop_codon:yes gene_type:complete
MRNETHLDHIATIIQIGHVNKLTSDQIAANVMHYITTSKWKLAAELAL